MKIDQNSGGKKDEGSFHTEEGAKAPLTRPAIPEHAWRARALPGLAGSHLYSDSVTLWNSFAAICFASLAERERTALRLRSCGGSGCFPFQSKAARHPG